MLFGVKFRISILVCLFLIFGCDRGEVVLPERPANVPAYAVWSGGIDGGSWFHCKNNEKQWNYYCVVYDEYNGDVVDEGEYVLKSIYWDKDRNEAIIEDFGSLTLAFSNYDGDTIDLSNSMTLIKKK
jgi:hypothetical protein